MAYYRRVPTVVEAFLYGTDPWPTWFDNLADLGLIEVHQPSSSDRSLDYLIINTKHGKLHVAQGWFVMRWPTGHLHAYKPKVFNEIFEPVEEVA